MITVVVMVMMVHGGGTAADMAGQVTSRTRRTMCHVQAGAKAQWSGVIHNNHHLVIDHPLQRNQLIHSHSFTRLFKRIIHANALCYEYSKNWLLLLPGQ